VPLVRARRHLLHQARQTPIAVDDDELAVVALGAQALRGTHPGGARADDHDATAHRATSPRSPRRCRTAIVSARADISSMLSRSGVVLISCAW
jgi:hypothetical protein